MSELVISFCVAILDQSIAIFSFHLITTKVGMIFVEAEVLREGNDQVQDNLTEGVIILDSADLQPLYHNKAADADKSVRILDALLHR